jgi:hypothetical protein
MRLSSNDSSGECKLKDLTPDADATLIAFSGNNALLTLVGSGFGQPRSGLEG